MQHVLTTGAFIGAIFAPEFAVLWVIGGVIGGYMTCEGKLLS